MKKAIILFIFLIFLSTIIKAENPTSGININVVNLATKFLNNLQKMNTPKIKNMLSRKVQLEILDREKILMLTDEMMTEKISVFDYIVKITGHNIQQFLKNKLQILKFSKPQDMGMERRVEDKNIKGDFYFIKFKITYKNKNSNQTIVNRLIEIDIKKENNKFKIVGFII